MLGFLQYTSRDMLRDLIQVPAARKGDYYTAALVCMNFLAVSEADYKANCTKNPVNLIRVCNVCDSAQSRYKLHPIHLNVEPALKYLAYRQCLPGCVVVKNETSIKQTSLIAGRSVSVPLTSDILCKAYDGAKTQQQGKNRPQKLKSSSSEAPVGNSSDQGKKLRV